MTMRYHDIGLEAAGARDFVARQRVPTLAQVAIVLLSAFLIGISIVVSVRNTTALILVLFALFAIMGWYIILQLMRSRDQILITEFQNALFASAIGLHNKFCLIIKRDGGIIYLDRSFQSLFPQFNKLHNNSVDALLKHGKVSTAEKELIEAGIEKGTYQKVIFTLTDAHDVSHRVILSIEPIMRPAGFTILRGREYIEHRSEQLATSGSSSTSGLLNSNSMVLLSHVMESMKMGVYITSPEGGIVYCNPLFEQWLGYQEGEIAARNLAVSNLLPAEINNISDTQIDIERVVQMSRKNGGFISLFLNQRLIQNDAGEKIGATAVVHLYHENQLSISEASIANASLKKKTLR